MITGLVMALPAGIVMGFLGGSLEAPPWLCFIFGGLAGFVVSLICQQAGLP